MTPAFFIVVTDANFVPILATDGPTGTNLIQGSVSRNGFTSYITGNLVPPATRLYAARSLVDANGNLTGYIVSQSKLPAYATCTDTFMGWAIPA